MASDLPKHSLGASANIRAQLGRLDQKSWTPDSPFLINAPNSERADVTGLQTGALIADNAVQAEILKPLQSDLQEKSGVDIGLTYFQNWGDTQESLLLYAKPKTVLEVKELVKAAADPEIDIKVGMGGAYHSWSPMFPDAGGLLINVCDLKLDDIPAGDSITTDGNCRIYHDSASVPMTVTISPGVTTGELMQYFLEHEICFESDVILPTVTYGGVLSGGCHGTGKDQTSMSDWITTMKVVDGIGILRTLPDLESSGTGVTTDEILKAAQVCLGVFGVVVEFTLEVQPMSNRRVWNNFENTLGGIFPRNGSTTELSQLLKKNWSVELFWFPFNSILSWLEECLPTASALQITTPRYPVPAESDGKPGENILVTLWSPWMDKLWIREITKTPNIVTQEPGVPLWSKLMDVAGGVLGSQLLAPLYEAFPGLVPLGVKTGFEVVKRQYGGYQQKDEVVRVPWAVHFRDAIDLISVYDLEFGFPININDPKKAVEAVRAVIDITTSYARKGEYPSEKNDGENTHFPLTMCMEMRVVRKGRAFLCPSSIGDYTHVAYIEVLSTSGTQGYEQYFTDVAKAWIDLGGIPHWHKQWAFLKDCEIGDSKQTIFDYIRSKYGDNMTKFKQVRSELNLDPADRFLNSTMRDVLYDKKVN